MSYPPEKLSTLPAPEAPRNPTMREHHGERVEDPYSWLSNREDPAVIAHLEAENAYCEQQTAHLAPLRATMFEEIRGRVLETDLSVPTKRGDWWYYSRTQEGAQYPIHCRTVVIDSSGTPPELSPGEPVPGEQVLLDVNALATGHEFFALGAFDVSDDGNILLWSADTTGDERYRVEVRDLRSGATLSNEISNTASAFLTPDGRGVIYTTLDDSWRPDTLWWHELGRDVASAAVLYQESDERFWLGAGITRSRRFLVISVGSSITSEEHLIDLAVVQESGSTLAGAQIVTIWPRREGVEYSSDHAIVNDRDVLLIMHNDQAPDFALVQVDLDNPQGTARTVIAHTPGQRLLDLDCFENMAAVQYRTGGLSAVGILDYESGELSQIQFPEALSTVGVGANPEWAITQLRLGYGSFITPSTVFDYELATAQLHLRKQQVILGDFSSQDYDQRRLWATATDGTQIPISLVWKKSFGDPLEPAALPRPVHLYGYGSYEHSIDPAFSAARLSELDRGVVFAVAHIRGGGEMGRHWYEQGKLLSKKNTFTDFIDCAKLLVQSGITSPERMVAEGGSAGGLLMGAVANLAPELFAGILASVPFVDALTTILDPSLPLTVIEWDEWGNPLENREVYEYMRQYSPYDNVQAGADYPRILAVTSLNDTRVFYAEPAKWVQKLRHAGAADVLLKCEMSAGHGGVSGRYNAWHERAWELSWLLDVLGVAE